MLNHLEETLNHRKGMLNIAIECLALGVVESLFVVVKRPCAMIQHLFAGVEHPVVECPFMVVKGLV